MCWRPLQFARGENPGREWWTPKTTRLIMFYQFVEYPYLLHSHLPVQWRAPISDIASIAPWNRGPKNSLIKSWYMGMGGDIWVSSKTYQRWMLKRWRCTACDGEKLSELMDIGSRINAISSTTCRRRGGIDCKYCNGASLAPWLPSSCMLAVSSCELPSRVC